MPKWSDMLARVIPWLRSTEEEDTRRLRDDAAAVRREQQQLAPLIAAQTDYLVRRGELNGFTRRLRIGFQLGSAGE